MTCTIYCKWVYGGNSHASQGNCCVAWSLVTKGLLHCGGSWHEQEISLSDVERKKLTVLASLLQSHAAINDKSNCPKWSAAGINPTGGRIMTANSCFRGYCTEEMYSNPILRCPQASDCPREILPCCYVTHHQCLVAMGRVVTRFLRNSTVATIHSLTVYESWGEIGEEGSHHSSTSVWVSVLGHGTMHTDVIWWGKPIPWLWSGFGFGIGQCWYHVLLLPHLFEHSSSQHWPLNVQQTEHYANFNHDCSKIPKIGSIPCVEMASNSAEDSKPVNSSQYL